MRKITPADYRRMPWKSGGGTTTELVIEPHTASVGGPFLYRISIADVASDGPFSKFDGCDRHIMLLEGAGMTLDCGTHGRIDLTQKLVPRSFSGDWAVAGALVAGPVRDFNLIVDRRRATSSLVVQELSTGTRLELGDGETCVVYVVDGALGDAAAGDTLVIDSTVELMSSRRARVALARITLT